MTFRVNPSSVPLPRRARRAVAAAAAAALLVTGAGLVIGPALTAGAASPTLPDFGRSTICPICDTSNRPASLRVCRCSLSTPVANCTGMS